MTVSEAMQRGLTKLRKQHWAFEDDHLELQRFEKADRTKYYGPWATLVSLQSTKALDESYGRQEILILGDTTDDWVEYIEGPASE